LQSEQSNFTIDKKRVLAAVVGGIPPAISKRKEDEEEQAKAEELQLYSRSKGSSVKI